MISVKPQESPAIFPTVEKPTNLFSSEPFRNLLATIYPLVWEKTLNIKSTFTHDYLLCSEFSPP